MNLRGAYYLLREGVRSVLRNPGLSLAAVVSMSASLLVFGVFIVLTSNIEHAARSVEERKVIDVYIAETVEAEGLPELGTTLAAFEGVSGIQFISKDEALAAFGVDAGRYDLVEELGYNPLPASFRLELEEHSRSSERMNAIAQRIRAVTGVEDVRYGGEWVDRLESALVTMRIADLIMGLLVGLSACFVVGSTIRLTVLARREMIEIMRVVGATDLYIRTPFVLEGVLQALIAGGLTLLLLRLVVDAVSPGLGGLEFLSTLGVVSFLAFSCVLGLVGSVLSLRWVLGKIA